MTNGAENSNVLLEVKDLRKFFPIKRGFLSRTVGYVRAVDRVNFFGFSGGIWVWEDDDGAEHIEGDRADVWGSMV